MGKLLKLNYPAIICTLGHQLQAEHSSVIWTRIRVMKSTKKYPGFIKKHKIIERR